MAMIFKIDGRHVEITPAIEAYIKKKMQRIEKIVVNRITTIHAILSVEKHLQKAEAELKIAGDENIIFAEASTNDLYESIDKLEDKLYAQVFKFHDKSKNHHDKKHREE